MADTSSLLRDARLVVMDVDGTLTDGKVLLLGGSATERAQEIQAFDVRDGIGLRWLSKAGLQLAWISGRGTGATQARGAELGIHHVLLRIKDKHAELTRLQAQLSITPAQTVAMGDDLPDLGLRAGAGFFAAPADAVEEIRARADLVTRAVGGHGAFRELAEAILRARGEWTALVESYAR